MLCISSFVLSFLEKLYTTLNKTVLFLDNICSVTDLPACGAHDPNAKARAESEKEDMNLFVEEKIIFDELIVKITDRFIAVFESKNVPPLFFMSPFFAYMPYVKSLWNYPIMGLKVNTNDKLKELSKMMTECALKKLPDVSKVCSY